MEKVSVIIPVYNREQLLPRTLDSILAQERLPEEVILVDNNSSDGSLAVCHEYERRFAEKKVCSQVISEPLQGAAAARQAGLDIASNEWILFFDSDDIMHPEHIKRVMETAESHRNADIIGWDVICRYQSGKALLKRFPTKDYIWNNIIHGSLATIAYMARKELLVRAGGWDIESLFWDDIELASRMLLSEPQIIKMQGKPSVMALASDISITGTGYKHAEEKAKTTLYKISKTLKAYPYLTAIKASILAGDIFLEDKEAGNKFFRLLKEGKLIGPLKGFSLIAAKTCFNLRKNGVRGSARLFKPFVIR